MNKVVAIVVALTVMLMFVTIYNVQTTMVKDGSNKIILLQDESPQTTSPTEEAGKEENKDKEEEEGEEEELDYELGKVDPNTKKATRYVCPDCGEVQLTPFKCEICEKDAVKEELDVEEKNGKWFIKGTNTQIVEKEPEEEEEETEEKGGEKSEGPSGGGNSGKGGGGGSKVEAE